MQTERVTKWSHWVIDQLWNGEQALPSERSEVAFALNAEGLSVKITAKFHDDKPPATEPGRTASLWNFEVIELFLANDAGHYLELEFGPHGHYLALLFSGIRKIQRQDISLSFDTKIVEGTWHGTALVSSSYLPTRLCRANAYAIHGQAPNRRYLAAFPVPGPRPDFHQPHFFQPWQASPARP
ncbi:MAG: hypothetical protein PHI06_04565 [Desulfobulbaceae bacterium]|nr:hypothetical protein [Desulfobulbaceae bacterium]